MIPILKNAVEHGYGQPGFNVTCLPQLNAVLEAHSFLRSPALVQVGGIAMGFLGGADEYGTASLEDRRRGAERICRAVEELEKEYSVPVAINADHAKDIETISMVIDAGFTSVMIDGSHLPLDQNKELTREVVKLAHQNGVTVEAELGVLSGMEDDIFSEKSSYTDPMDVVDFVADTGVDCLALSYGTKHGAMKGTDVKLRREIVIASRENLKHRGFDVPLVSHGSSTVPSYIVSDINRTGGRLDGFGGIPVSELKAVIESGIGKINIDTDMRLSITRNIREYVYSGETQNTTGVADIRSRLEENPAEIDFRVFLKEFQGPLVENLSPQSPETAAVFDAIDRGVKEIVCQLLVQFGAVGRNSTFIAPSLAEMAENYRI